MINIPNYLEEWIPGPNESPWHLVQHIKESFSEQLAQLRPDNPDSLEIVTSVHSAGKNNEWLLILVQVYDSYNWGQFHRICGIFVPLTRPVGQSCWPVRYMEGTVRPWDVEKAQEEFETDIELAERVHRTLDQWTCFTGSLLERD